MLNCFYYLQWWFVLIAVGLLRLHLFSVSKGFCISWVFIQWDRSASSDAAAQAQQETLGLFLGASKLGSDREWLFSSNVACFFTCLWGGEKKNIRTIRLFAASHMPSSINHFTATETALSWSEDRDINQITEDNF